MTPTAQRAAELLCDGCIGECGAMLLHHLSTLLPQCQAWLCLAVAGLVVLPSWSACCPNQACTSLTKHDAWAWRSKHERT